MSRRKGLGKGKGKGYKNIIPKYDERVHSDSGRGRKQPNKMSMAQKIAVTKNLNLKDSDRDGVADSMDCRPNDPKKQDDLPEFEVTYEESEPVIFQESKELKEIKGYSNEIVDLEEAEPEPEEKSRTKKYLEKGRSFYDSQMEKTRQRKKDKIIRERSNVRHPVINKLNKQEDRVDELKSRISREDDWDKKQKLMDELKIEESELSEIQEKATNIDMQDFSDGQLKTLAIRHKDDSIFFSSNPYTKELKRRIENKRKIETELREKRAEQESGGLFDGLF